MKRLDTPHGSFEYDERVGTTDPLAGALFHVPTYGRTPIYDQLRDETGLDPAPWPLDTSLLKHAYHEDTWRYRFRLDDLLDVVINPYIDPSKTFIITGV